MKTIFLVFWILVVVSFVTWLWTLVWNYGIVVLLAKYAVATLAFYPALATAALFTLLGLAIGLLLAGYALSLSGITAKDLTIKK
jgi:hypothetical protein